MARGLPFTLGAALFAGTLLTAPLQAVEDTSSINPRSWYSDYLSVSPMALSPSGGHVLLNFEGTLAVVDVKTGKRHDLSAFATAELSTTRAYTTWMQNGSIRMDYRLEDGWHQAAVNPSDLSYNKLPDSNVVTELHLASQSCETFGLRVVGEVYGFHYLPCDGEAKLLHNERVLGMAIAADGKQAAWTMSNPEGGFDLHVFGAVSGETKMVAAGLDGGYNKTNIAFSPDGKAVYMSLATGDPVDLASREAPQADDRWLKIFAVDLATSAKKVIYEVPGQDVTILGVSGDTLHYHYTEATMKAAVMPFVGGTARDVSDSHTTSFPFWHPSGTRLSVTYGDWRISDWVMNWDLGSYTVDGSGKPIGPLAPEVTGHHEDYGLTWSPDGKWMAYHSHRSDKPVAAYGSEGATDDIWLQPATGGKEIRLTAQGYETVQPDWAPDSKRLVYATMNKTYKPYIITINGDSGEATSLDELVVKGMEETPFLSASWSQSKAEIALEEKGKGRERKLWLVNEDGSNPRLLATYEMVTELAGTDFTPDGKWVLYSGLKDGHHQLFRAATDGSGSVQITSNDKEHLAPQVSPDGAWIASINYKHKRTFGSVLLAK